MGHARSRGRGLLAHLRVFIIDARVRVLMSLLESDSRDLE